VERVGEFSAPKTIRIIRERKKQGGFPFFAGGDERRGAMAPLSFLCERGVRAGTGGGLKEKTSDCCYYLFGAEIGATLRRTVGVRRRKAGGRRLCSREVKENTSPKHHAAVPLQKGDRLVQGRIYGERGWPAERPKTGQEGPRQRNPFRKGLYYRAGRNRATEGGASWRTPHHRAHPQKGTESKARKRREKKFSKKCPGRPPRRGSKNLSERGRALPAQKLAVGEGGKFSCQGPRGSTLPQGASAIKRFYPSKL